MGCTCKLDEHLCGSVAIKNGNSIDHYALSITNAVRVQVIKGTLIKI